MAKSETDLRSMVANGPDPKHYLGYSKIPSEQVVKHVNDMGKQRDRAFAVFPYPCIGSFRFLDLSIPQSPVYPEVLERLKSGEKLLDVGCAIGQELRQLVFDGVPLENLYASHLRQDFYDVGYELFADKSKLTSEFIQADTFDENSALVHSLADKVDINAASFFHLFSQDQQVAVARRVVNLLRARPGSLLIGRQAGCLYPVDPDDKENAPRHYRYDGKTWRRLQVQVGKETGTKWDIWSRTENETVGWS